MRRHARPGASRRRRSCSTRTSRHNRPVPVTSAPGPRYRADALGVAGTRSPIPIRSRRSGPRADVRCRQGVGPEAVSSPVAPCSSAVHARPAIACCPAADGWKWSTDEISPIGELVGRDRPAVVDAVRQRVAGLREHAVELPHALADLGPPLFIGRGRRLRLGQQRPARRARAPCAHGGRVVVADPPELLEIGDRHHEDRRCRAVAR